MGENKGKPSGKYAEKKGDPGALSTDSKRQWPENAQTQHVDSATGEQQGQQRQGHLDPDDAQGRNRKAGSPR